MGAHLLTPPSTSSPLQACSNLEQGYNPAVTFVVVQKRHNTRLLPGPGGPADRSGNILPGEYV